MGTHRSHSRSRGISKGPVIAVVAVLLLVGAVFGWFQLRDRSSSDSSAAAAECVEGDTVLNVTVDPSIEAPVRMIADRYNATEPIVGDHCVTVAVQGRPASAVVATFTANAPWDPALGPQPALWIPESMRQIESVRVPGLIQGTPASVAVSPIALAVPGELGAALQRAGIAWADLPRLQRSSLDELQLPWGGLAMAMPPGDATLAAATAVASWVSGTEPLTEEAARSGQVVAAVSALATSAPEVADTRSALGALTSAPPAAATLHAVAATEQQINAHGGLTAFVPAGAAPVADYPAAMMTGHWVDTTQNRAAGVFVDYLRAPQQAAVFAAAGFGPAPATTAAVPTRAALDKVRATLDDPVLGVSATVLLDVSASMAGTDGSTTRLTNTLGALRSTMNVMPPDFGLGVWTFGKNLDGTTPYRVQAATAPLAAEHRTEVTASLNAIRPSDLRADQCYPALLAAYRAAVSGYTSGRTNSVLLITDGPEDDSALTGAQLLADLTAAADPATPVRVDVIVIGAEGTDTLRSVTERTGGTYTRVPTSNDISFGTAMVQALTTT
ncbi:substrate-binding domain-containing protein [Nocardia cyriacigeorgica]|uniref:substrate-binding domain-containing protein n=1 Tax=Nocardia cyriacigeorgica TaxID=135487 RepID=UPI0018932EF6|nr:substrate-binding domain-containing protein [Nocardia cyriacigeorgica]MBF6346816.1 substrate-binding domain-containing protein [Nocardia cyriacigeorgica]